MISAKKADVRDRDLQHKRRSKPTQPEAPLRATTPRNSPLHVRGGAIGEEAR